MTKGVVSEIHLCCDIAKTLSDSKIDNRIRLKDLHSGEIRLRNLGETTPYASGGCCDIYLSYADDITIATKVIRDRYVNNDYAKEIIAREISFLKKMNHVAIPRLISVKKDGLGFSYEFIKGVTLGEIMMQQKTEIRKLQKQFITCINSVICYLESKEIIHGDIVPENIIYSYDLEKFYLVDFGAAFSLGEIGIPHPIGRRDWFQKIMNDCKKEPYEIDRKAIDFILREWELGNVNISS